MRRAMFLALLLGACTAPPHGGGGHAGGTTAGGGIVSLNPCADAMLVRLVPAARIAAISRYSQDPAATSMPLALARRFRTTAGTAEEVIALAPDLVVASSFTPPATRDAFARAGLRVTYLDAPQTIAASKAQVADLARTVGAPDRGRALVAEIDRAVAAYTRPAAARRPAALLYIGGDMANGSGTLLDEMTTRAGFRNAAADYGLAYTGTLATETIVTHPPAIVIAPDSGGAGRGAAMRRALLPDTPDAPFARRLVNCGGPTIVPAMRRLAQIRAGL